MEIIAFKQETLGIFKSDMKGLLLGCGIFLLGGLITKNGIGMGDVKMYAAIALFMGDFGTLFSLLVSLFIDVLLLPLSFLRRGKKPEKTPYL